MTLPSDLAALLVPGRTLTEGDVAALRAAVGAPRWQVRQERLDARDAALRKALAACGPVDRTTAARRVAAAWAAFKRGAPVPPELTVPLRQADGAHGDRPALSWDQIHRIARAHRTPLA